MLDQIRKGYTKSRFNEEYASLIPYEILFTSIFMGFYFTSWWVFLIAFFVFLFGVQIPILAEFIVMIFCIPIGLFFGFIASFFGGIPAFITIGLISYLVAIYVHFTSLQYNRDIFDAS